MQTLISKEDKSVNFILDSGLECRFVQRNQDYFIIYLSSQTGCDQACRFCHLTQLGLTDTTQASYDDFINQARIVLEHFFTLKQSVKNKINKVHINFMSRGEPLNNPTFMNENKKLIDGLEMLVLEHVDISEVKFKVSTIMPSSLDQIKFKEIIDDRLEFYYSLYSTSEVFRKRWLPKALDYKKALELLKFKRVKIHYCLIEGENDSPKEATNISIAIHKSGLDCEFNLVRYNPFSSGQGKESDELTRLIYMQAIDRHDSFGKIKIIPRVGTDVKASCGMFVNNKKPIIKL